MEHLNSFSASGGGNLNKTFPKSKMPGGLPGGGCRNLDLTGTLHRSTTRVIHDRAREHLNNNNSSVKKHISKCQTKVQKGIEIKTIVLENDPVNLRLFEAF